MTLGQLLLDGLYSCLVVVDALAGTRKMNANAVDGGRDAKVVALVDHFTDLFSSGYTDSPATARGLPVLVEAWGVRHGRRLRWPALEVSHAGLAPCVQTSTPLATTSPRIISGLVSSTAAATDAIPVLDAARLTLWP